MTAPTPEQMRALADLGTSDYRLQMNEVRAALRAAADQLEAQSRALHAAGEFQIGTEVTEAITAALGAATAYQEDDR
jgi:hypothetical protein